VQRVLVTLLVATQNRVIFTTQQGKGKTLPTWLLFSAVDAFQKITPSSRCAAALFCK
jgi:hypothetical protein